MSASASERLSLGSVSAWWSRSRHADSGSGGSSIWRCENRDRNRFSSSSVTSRRVVRPTMHT
jgi:hypothetical protein